MGVISFGVAAFAGHLLSPVIAILLFVWMIAYHAAASEGLHANRIARVFAPGHPKKRILTPSPSTAMTTERTDHAEPRDPPH